MTEEHKPMTEEHKLMTKEQPPHAHDTIRDVTAMTA
jgi:hypothetical protein